MLANWLRNAIAPREINIKNIKRLNYEVGWPDGGDLRRKIDDQMVCRRSSRNSRLVFDLLTISCGFAISLRINFHILKLRLSSESLEIINIAQESFSEVILLDSCARSDIMLKPYKKNIIKSEIL